MQVTAPKPRRIHWDRTRCTSCLACTVVCAERHTGMSAPSRAHIRIHIDATGGESSAEYCRQCSNAPCAAACPEEAIRFDAHVLAWLVHDALCTSCGRCVEACRFGAIRIDPVIGLAAKCDLCHGTPRCVEVCMPGALVLRGKRGEARDGA